MAMVYIILIVLSILSFLAGAGLVLYAKYSKIPDSNKKKYYGFSAIPFFFGILFLVLLIMLHMHNLNAEENSKSGFTALENSMESKWYDD
jgi:hypothetical protein